MQAILSNSTRSARSMIAGFLILSLIQPLEVALASSLLSPSISVTHNGTQITNGSNAPISFGTVLFGTTHPTRTFTVKNTGYLSLSPISLTAPSGFVISHNTWTGELRSGNSAQFTIDLLTNSIGTKSGTVDLQFSNTTGSSQFSFSISGTIAQNSQSPAPSPTPTLTPTPSPSISPSPSPTPTPARLVDTRPWNSIQQRTSPWAYEEDRTRYVDAMNRQRLVWKQGVQRELSFYYVSPDKFYELAKSRAPELFPDDGQLTPDERSRQTAVISQAQDDIPKHNKNVDLVYTWVEIQIDIDQGRKQPFASSCFNPFGSSKQMIYCGYIGLSSGGFFLPTQFSHMPQNESIWDDTKNHMLASGMYVIHKEIDGAIDAAIASAYAQPVGSYDPKPSSAPTPAPTPLPTPSQPPTSSPILSPSEITELNSVLDQLAEQYAYYPTVTIAGLPTSSLSPYQKYEILLRDAQIKAQQIVTISRDLKSIASHYGSRSLDTFSETTIGVFEPFIQYKADKAAELLSNVDTMPQGLRTYLETLSREASSASKAMRIGGAIIGVGSEFNQLQKDLKDLNARNYSDFLFDTRVSEIIDDFAARMAGRGVVILVASTLSGPGGVVGSIVLSLIPVNKILSDALRYTRDCPVRKLLGKNDYCYKYD